MSGMVAIILALSGLVVAVSGVPLLQGRVGPNPWYGMRTRKTRSDRDIWYAANRFCGRELIFAGLMQAPAMLALYLAFLVAGVRAPWCDGVATGAYLTLLMVAIIRSFAYLQKL